MTYEKSLERLDDQQLDAVISDAKTLVIEAVPGSGKTTTIAAKAAYLIKEEDVPANRIVMLTYTKAAVADIRRRMLELFPDVNTRTMRVSTIHSLCHTIISEHVRRTHMPMPKVADQLAVRYQMRKIVKQKTGGARYLTDEELSTIETIAGFYKNMRTLPKKTDPMREFYDVYQEAMAAQGPNVIDYDDMMAYAMKILELDQTSLEKARKMFDFWLIDEAQDCSPLQHQIISALTDKANVTFVGDTDQSIYGFRAAKPELLEDIMRRKDVTSLRIESNYRAGNCLCEVANKFIGHDASTKHIIATRDECGTISFSRNRSRKPQYDALIEFARSHDGDCAILYRNNDLAFPLAQTLARKGIEFSMHNPNTSFMTSRPVRDISAFIHLADNPSDAKAFMQIYSKMSLFVKRADAESVAKRAKPGQNLFDELAKAATKKQVATRAATVAWFIQSLRTLTPSEIIHKVRKSAYKNYLQENGGAYRLGIVDELSQDTNNRREFDDMMDDLANIVHAHTNKKAPLVLSTIHSAKGLEWDNVAVMDMNAHVFPAPAPKGQTLAVSSNQEERNLMYVAMTRAKNNLMLASSAPKASEFLDEILVEHLWTVVEHEST